MEHGAEKADYPVLDLGTDPESGEAVRIRIGRFGPFVQVGEGGPGRTASLPEDVAPADLTVEKALELVRAKAEGPRTLGVDPATGQNVYVMNGRYGAYVQLGETPEAKGKEKAEGREAEARSLQAGMTDSTVTLEEALKLLSLAARRRPASGRQRADHDQLRPLRSVREARRRVPLARVGRRRVQHLVRRGARAAARAEAVAPPAVRRRRRCCAS